MISSDNLLISFQILISVGTLLLALFVLMKDASNTLNRSFFIVCLFISSWVICGSIIKYQEIININFLTTSRISMAIVLFLLFSFIVFSWHFPYKNSFVKSRHIWITFILTSILGLLSYNGIFLKDIIYQNGSSIRKFSNFIYIFTFIFVGAIIYTFVNIARKNLLTENKLLRRQGNYVLASLLCSFSVGALFSLILPMLGYNQLFFLGYFGPLIFIVMTAYAILRHRLMNIEVVIKKTAVYSIVTVLLAGFFLSFVLVGEFIFRNIVGYNSLWIAILTAFLFSMLFFPLRDWGQKFLDRIFFKEKYDFRSIFKRLTQTSSTILNLDQLLELVAKDISNTLKAENVSVFLTDQNTKNLKLRKNIEK